MEFYLSSHDLGSDILPHKCVSCRIAFGRHTGKAYYLVTVTPPIIASYWGASPRDYEQIILALAKGQTIADVGKKSIMADMVISPHFTEGSLDEHKCSKVGACTLHSTYDEALSHSPRQEKQNECPLDAAIINFSKARSKEALVKLQYVFLTERLHVPIVEPAMEIQAGHYDIPIICIRNDVGQGSIPAFSTVEHILKWKPEGCLYASISGFALLQMALKMDQISEVVVNINSSPSGSIPRKDFHMMLQMNQRANQ